MNVRATIVAGLLAVAAVPAPAGEAVELTFHGEVITERGDVESLLPPARNLVVRWLCEDGADLSAGDPIILFDNRGNRERLQRLRLERRIDQLRSGDEERALSIGLENLRDEGARLRQQLAVTRASLARLVRVDPERVALLAAELRSAELAAGKADRELKRRRALHAAGRLAASDVEAAEITCARRRNSAELAELRWRRASGRIDTVAVARLRLREHEILLQLGESGATEAGKRGLAKRIEAVEKEIAEKRKRAAFRARRARRELQEAVRDTWDHTPLAWLELRDPSGGSPRRISFQPAAQPAPSGWSVDAGRPYTGERGYGWDRDLRERMAGERSGDPERRGLVLVRERATWSCRLPGSVYELRLGIGDERPWHGVLVAVREPEGERTLLAADELEGFRVVEARVRTRDGRLRLSVGTPEAKSLRAPADGVARPQRWAHVGTRADWTDWPLAYFCRPESFKLQARIHQDAIPLLRVADAGNRDPPAAAAADRSLRIARARSAVAADAVTVHLPDGGALTGTVSAIGSTPVVPVRGRTGWWDADAVNPKDRIAREVTVAFPPAQARRLRLGETLRCSVFVRPLPGTRVLPGHLVSEDVGHLLVRCAETGRTAVEGFRVGDRCFVIAGLPAGARPLPPRRHAAADPEGRRFRGEVVPGKRTQVSIPTYWGRIEDLVPDGSRVELGERIITLYNPFLRENRKRFAEEKERARQDYLVAMETRRVKSVQAEITHRGKLLAERRARLDLLAAEEVDPVARHAAAADLRIAHMEEAAARDALDRLRRVPGTPPAAIRRVELAARRAELARRKAQLEHVRVLHGRDWPAILDARAAWHAAEAGLALREEELAIVRKEEKVARLLAQLRLEQAMRGNWVERTFARIREIRAPAAGRLFYRTGYNDQTGGRTKIGKDFVVWGGLTIAEILDMSELGMEAEFPEQLYTTVAAGDAAEIGFPAYPGLRIAGSIERVGKDFYLPEDSRAAGHGRQAVSISRVFTVEVRFRPPAELAQHLVPGTKGFVCFP